MEYRGKLSVDGRLVEPDTEFACMPEVGDWQWDVEGIVLHIDSVAPFMEGPEKRYHVHATRKR